MGYLEAIAELAMLAWESQLPDLPKGSRSVVISGDRMTEDGKTRLREYFEKCAVGGTKNEMVVIDGTTATRIDVQSEGAKPTLEDMYLGGQS
jgi:hypothetical protein